MPSSKNQRYARYLDNLPTEFKYNGFTIRFTSNVAQRPWALICDCDDVIGYFATAQDAQEEADAINDFDND